MILSKYSKIKERLLITAQSLAKFSVGTSIALIGWSVLGIFVPTLFPLEDTGKLYAFWILVIAPAGVATILLLIHYYLQGRRSHNLEDLKEQLNASYGIDLTENDVAYMLSSPVTGQSDEILSAVLNFWSVSDEDHHHSSPAYLYVKGEEVKLFGIVDRHELITPEVMKKVERITEFGNELFYDKRPVLLKETEDQKAVIFSESLRAQLYFGFDEKFEEIPQDEFWTRDNPYDGFILNPSSEDDLDVVISMDEMKYLFEK